MKKQSTRPIPSNHGRESAFRALANVGRAPSCKELLLLPPALLPYGAVCSLSSCWSPAPSDIALAPFRRPALFAAATARRSKPLLPLRFVFALEDDAVVVDSPARAAPTPFDDDAAAAAATALALAIACLSTRLRNGLGRFSSSAKSYSGDG